MLHFQAPAFKVHHLFDHILARSQEKNRDEGEHEQSGCLAVLSGMEVSFQQRKLRRGVFLDEQTRSRHAEVNGYVLDIVLKHLYSCR